MRSSSFGPVLRKDCRELFGANAFLLLVAVAGPLVGLSFSAAVRAYAEASGGGDNVAALASALAPLDGILVPSFGAYELLVMFLVPFVAIRMVSSEKASGALKLLLQSPAGMATQLASKVLALFLGWCVCLVPIAIALLLWRSYGGHLPLAETANLALGHTLRYLVTCGLALMAAAVVDNAATAAIAVLSFTIGTWALDFFAAGRGGLLAELGRYTPAAMLRQFERGLLGVSLVLISAIAVCALAAIAAAFLDLRLTRARRWSLVALVVVATALLTLGAMQFRGSADLSEDRRNSFGPADERLLRSLHDPLRIRLYMATEDPRANDYERNVLTKLRRTVRDLRVEYPYAGRSALFESDERYGTIEYTLGTRHAVSRSTTEEIVLDEIETLAGLTPPERGESTYPGYPLNAEPRGVALMFYLAWPALICALWLRGRVVFSTETQRHGGGTKKKGF